MRGLDVSDTTPAALSCCTACSRPCCKACCKAASSSDTTPSESMAPPEFISVKPICLIQNNTNTLTTHTQPTKQSHKQARLPNTSSATKRKLGPPDQTNNQTCTQTKQPSTQTIKLPSKQVLLPKASLATKRKLGPRCAWRLHRGKI